MSSIILCIILVSPALVMGQVFQPKQLVYTEGDEISINCTQNATSHDYMLWYQQKSQGDGGTLNLLGYSFEGSSLPAGDFNMDVVRASRFTRLTRKVTRLSDSGVYFCAVRDTANGSSHRQCKISQLMFLRMKMDGWTVQNGSSKAQNQTEFILVGLSNDPKIQLVLFAVFLVLYLLTLVGNILIMVTIVHERCLHTPMYFFLSNLSFIDVCHCSVTVPKMLADLLSAEKTISFTGCVAQMFFLHLFACTEIFLLTVMAYDRYVAICNPMHYLTVMNHKVCLLLVGSIWLGGSVHSLALTGMTIKLPYCGPRKVDNFFCDVPPVLKLACTNTYVIEILIVSNSGLISVVCFVVLVVSYGVILMSLRQRLVEGKRKALSTCAAHLTVVTLFLGHCIFIYSRPSTSFPEDKVVSVFFTAVTPLLNPIIYTLRNEDMKRALNKLLCRKVNTEKN
ncbi:olfactory receptor 4E1-like [Varanus komodoensis]|uniref:olfactory receptor 4E1-like n=1 Tax=Varanus komodoensis TaxID=61221 RepID=UPI001CF7969B|nr:olfactory receptor 4E1-like [Varanus komodoensis]